MLNVDPSSLRSSGQAADRRLQAPPLLVRMFNVLLSRLPGINGSMFRIEIRMPVDDLELVAGHYPDLVVIADVGETHALSVPHQFTL